MKKAFVILCLFSLAATAGETAYQKLKAKISLEVYTKIATTIKDSRKQPTFNFLYSVYEPYYNAYYDPSNNTINLGEGIYDLTRTFGKDSINALALVLGHELAHFYKDHGWGYSFGTANEYLKVSEKIYKLQLTPAHKVEKESQADYYGGLFGYMAGYNTLAVGADFFSKFYATAKVPDVTTGYPTKQERMSICDNSLALLKQLIPVYEAANYLVLLGEYEKAASLYDHIMVTFPSREIYNNEAAAYAMAALGLFEDGQIKYLYPFTIDSDTRMNAGGQKGLGEDKEQKRKEYLETARDLLENATKMDKEYAASFLNLALVYELLGEKELALAMAGKAYSLAEKEKNIMMMANASIAKGIILANDSRKEEAKAEFTKGQTGNKYVADINLKSLLKPSGAYVYQSDVSGEKHTGLEENINSIDASLLEAVLGDAKVLQIKKQNDEKPKMKIKSKSDALLTAIVIETYTYPKQTISFLFTGYNYEGASTKGVKVGSPVTKIHSEYGKPARIVTGTNRNYLIFEKTPIIFMTDKNDKVMGWMLYIK